MLFRSQSEAPAPDPLRPAAVWSSLTTARSVLATLARAPGRCRFCTCFTLDGWTSLQTVGPVKVTFVGVLGGGATCHCVEENVRDPGLVVWLCSTSAPEPPALFLFRLADRLPVSGPLPTTTGPSNRGRIGREGWGGEEGIGSLCSNAGAVVLKQGGIWGIQPLAKLTFGSFHSVCEFCRFYYLEDVMFVVFLSTCTGEK